MKRAAFVTLAVILFSSCVNKRSETTYYYAVDSLLREQTKLLSGINATLTKEATLNNKSETKSYIPVSETAWIHELDVFAEFNDMNKPANVGKYRTERGVKDPNSNLLIYQIENTEHLPVVFLKVYYLENLSNIRRIEGFYRQESSLLKSSRKVSMEFHDINNKIVLTSYSITGGQKMLLGDSVQFSVNGRVTLP